MTQTQQRMKQCCPHHHQHRVSEEEYRRYFLRPCFNLFLIQLDLILAEPHAFVSLDSWGRIRLRTQFYFRTTNAHRLSKWDTRSSLNLQPHSRMSEAFSSAAPIITTCPGNGLPLQHLAHTSNSVLPRNTFQAHLYMILNINEHTNMLVKSSSKAMCCLAWLEVLAALRIVCICIVHIRLRLRLRLHLQCYYKVQVGFVSSQPHSKLSIGKPCVFLDFKYTLCCSCHSSLFFLLV
jgi:hypothetical protein